MGKLEDLVNDVFFDPIETATGMNDDWEEDDDSDDDGDNDE